jgi:asparagine synthase (glutamine-hydrolysing)
MPHAGIELTAVGLSALESAVGAPLGSDPDPSRVLVQPYGAESPWEALLETFAPILARPPVLLAFSGGRDSSLLLAAAHACAQRHGLRQPIPLTYLNAGAPGTDERSWQRFVLQALHASDWEQVEGADELDFLGPVACAALERHGARYTPNAHFVVPLAQRAAGGTLVLGLGGDELLGGWRWSLRADVLARGAVPSPARLGTLLLGAAPPAARRALFRTRLDGLDAPWLTARARRQLRAAAAGEHDQPARWDRFVGWSIARRRLTVTQRTLRSLSAEAGASLSLPLLEPRFLSALAGAGGAHGWSSRTAAMEAIAGGRLPAEILRRASKAHFDEVYWGAAARRFARAWSGRLSHPELVDAAALRREWLAPHPRARSALLLQLAWLGDRVLQSVDG